MACYRLWALWLLCLLKGPEASRGDPAPMQVIGTLGKSVTLHLEIPRGEELEDLTWSKEGTIAIVTPGEPIKVIDKKIRDRVEVMSNNYSLQINSLTLEDAGVYRAQINIKDSDMTTTKEYNLQVYEQLTEPQVRMNSTVLKDGHCIIFLICSVNARRNDVTYSWSPLGPNAAVSNGGSVIQISWKPCNADWNYTCTAKNPVSFSTFQVTPSWDLCPGPGTSEGNLTPTIVIGTLGDLITFPLEIPSGVESIVWISNTSLTKTEPGEVGKLKRVKTQRPDRIRDPARDFSLQIPNVQMENQGLYIAHVCTNSSSIPTTHWFSLQVYKQLKKIKGTVSSRTNENQTCTITMTCQVQDNSYGDNVTYSWTPLRERVFGLHEGPVLSVSLRPGDNKVNYTCTARNPVSNSSYSFPAWQLCPESKKNRKAWLALLGLLGLPVPCWYVWKKKRRGHCFDCCRTQTQSGTPEELPEYKKLELVFEGSSRREGSVDSDTTLEDNMVHKPICESTVKHGPMPDEGDAYDAVCGEEEIYDPVTPEEISYVQISQEETPNPQKFQSSETIYCVVKKPQTVGSLKSDTESPEASLYENLT
ncbi:T-lymphocyte surface antigen Ly-9-like [Trichosurus vulpecula]|uniref:T-lymphocyte surface antigen Ly-9-like n=1 Tax=Trichosurus vulpecula TaxID=9337 RepID=UPI00186AC728|nr:T-lymphocyte surface antigen Ly-9-like [Trichosurus vulpecula]